MDWPDEFCISIAPAHAPRYRQVRQCLFDQRGKNVSRFLTFLNCLRHEPFALAGLLAAKVRNLEAVLFGESRRCR